MDRKEFLAAAGLFGACFCCGTTASAESASPQPASVDPRELAALQAKIDFMQRRFGRLIAVLDEPTRAKVLDALGTECARNFSGLTQKYKGRPKEFLEAGKRGWMESASYDEKTGEIHVVDKPGNCTCAFVKQGLTPAEFCACTLAWQKEAYSTILGVPVGAELESSILRGDRQCAFKIRRKV